MLTVPVSLEAKTGLATWDFEAQVGPGRIANFLLVALPTDSRATIRDLGAALQGPQGAIALVGFPLSPWVWYLDFMGSPDMELALRAHVTARFPDPGTFTIRYELTNLEALAPYGPATEEATTTVVVSPSPMPLLPIGLGLGVAAAVVAKRRR